MPRGFYSTGGGATLFFMAFAAIMSIFDKRKRRYSAASRVKKKSRPKPLAIPLHPGLTSEVFTVSVLDPVRAKRTLVLPVGTRVELKLIDDNVYVVAAGVQQLLFHVFYDDPVYTVLAENKQYYAYIKERDESATGFYDFFDIIVYF